MDRKFDLSKRFSAEDLSKELDDIWTQVQTDPEITSSATAKGVDLKTISRETAITVRHDGVGIDPVFTPIIIGLATAMTPIVAEVIKDLWEKVILPRIRKDKGDDALKPR